MDEQLISGWRERFYQAIKLELPSIDQYGSLVTSLNEQIAFDFRFPSKNSLIKGSHYHLGDGPYEFIHFTSLKNLFSILQEKAIRLYCLKNQKDISEFEFAALTYQITNQEYIDRKKASTYIFSLTDSGNSFNEIHWREFGHNRKGVWIKFVFEDYNNWRNFYLSKVDYTSTNYFLPVFNLMNELNNSGKGQAAVDLTELLSFHKRENFLREEEIRLLFSSTKEVYSDFLRSVRADSDMNGNLVHFYSLPLKGIGLEIHLNETPLVSIVEICIGHNIPAPGDIIATLRNVMSPYQQVRFSISKLPRTV